MALKFDFAKLPWHAQLGAFATLALAGVGAFWYFYAADQRVQLETKRQELTTLEAEVSRGIATAKKLPEFRKQVTVLEAQLDRLRAVLPEEQDVADLLRRVQAMATQSNLTIRGFSPAAVTRKEMHAEWPIGLKLSGSYHDLGTFLERVSKFPRIINVGAMHIMAREAQSASATVEAECTAMTFVLVKDPAAEKTKTAQGKVARAAGSAAAAGE
jgi:type IV pilus assembly protein PilO